MGRKKKKKISGYEKVLPFVFLVLLVLIWSLWTFNLKPETILPSPVELIKSTLFMVSNGQLSNITLITLKRVLMGLFLGSLVGLILAVLSGIFKLIDLILHPPIHIFRNVPVIAFLIVMMLFGIGENVVIFLLAVEVFFPVYISTYRGIKSVDKKLIDMGKVTGFDKFTIFREILFPTAIFSMINGIKQSFRSLWTLLIAIDLILTYQRLGSISADSWKSVQLDQLLISILLYIVLCKLVYSIVEVFEKRAFSWK